MKKDSNRVNNLQKELDFDEIKPGEPESLSAKTNFEEARGEKEKITVTIQPDSLYKNPVMLYKGCGMVEGN